MLCCVDPFHEQICSSRGLLEYVGYKLRSLADAADQERSKKEETKEHITCDSAIFY